MLFGKGLNHSIHYIIVDPWNAFSLTTLPNDKILDWSILKAYADDKINVAEKWKTWAGKSRKLCGKEKENAGYQHFHLFPQCFQKDFFSQGH